MNILKKFQKRPFKKYNINVKNKLNAVLYGSFYLKALENAYFTSKQLESFRKLLARNLKKNSKIWLRIRPNSTITTKLGDKRMGKGKGDIALNIFKLHAGSIFCEIETLNVQTIPFILAKAKKKLPFQSKIFFKKSL